MSSSWWFLFKLDLCEVVFYTHIFNVHELLFVIVSAVKNLCVQIFLLIYFLKEVLSKIHSLFGTKEIYRKLFLLKFTYCIGG